jgi:hypothetical protein
MDDSSPSLVQLTRNCGRAVTSIIGISLAPERNVLSYRGGRSRSYVLFLEDDFSCIAVRDISVASRSYEKNGQVEKEIPFVVTRDVIRSAKP